MTKYLFKEKIGCEKISEKVGEVTLRMQELVGAVVVSYYYSPELSIPIIRVPEFSQMPDSRTWEAITFDLAKRSFNILDISTKEPDFNPKFTVFKNQMQETEYSVVGYAYSVPIIDKYGESLTKYETFQEKMVEPHCMSINLIIRKGKERRLSRKKVKKQLKEELRQILVILRNSEDINRLLGAFLHRKFHGTRLKEEGNAGWEVMMLSQTIDMIYAYLGNEPLPRGVIMVTAWQISTNTEQG